MPQLNASYNGMFSSSFLGNPGKSSSFGGRIASGMGAALGGSRSVAQKELVSSMESLNRALTAPRTIDRSNVFKVNAEAADAYKRAFNAAERAAEAIQKRKEADMAKLERKKPAALSSASKEDIARIKAKSDAKGKLTNAEKDLLKADRNYTQQRDAINRKYNAPLASLGSQLQLMAANRGFIAATTQKIYDETQKNPGASTSGTFDGMMRSTQLLNADAAAATSKDSGAVNEVYRVEIAEKDLFVKPGERTTAPAKVASSTKLDQLADIGVIPYEVASQPDLAAHFGGEMVNESAFRDQGAQMVGKLLGVDSIVPSRLGMDDRSGYVSIMDASEGRRGDTFVSVQSPEEAAATDARIAALGARCAEGGVEPHEMTKFRALDLSNPSLQVAALQLGTLDYICGQIDRHPGNFFISEKDGRFRMTGIDNDSAFATGDKAQVPNLREVLPFVTPELKAKIEALDPDEAADSLKGIVDRGPNGDRAIEDVRARITALKEHVKTVPVKAESELNAETAKQLQAHNTPKHKAPPFGMMMDFSQSGVHGPLLRQGEREVEQQIRKKQEAERAEQRKRDKEELLGPGEAPAASREDPGQRRVAGAPADTRPRSPSAPQPPARSKGR